MILCFSCAGSWAQENTLNQPDPRRFLKEIEAFAIQDSISLPKEGGIVFAGSSSFRFWHDSIAIDMYPLSIIPRGFGGSHMSDLLYFADRLILPYKPSAVVVYEGDNDVAYGISPGQIAQDFDQLVDLIHSSFPACKIYFLSIKPSPSRWSHWPVMQSANHLISKICERNELMHFVDVASPMLDENGRPKPYVFLADSLHLNRQGYLLWREVLRPVLMNQ